MIQLCDEYKKVFQKHFGKPFPQDPLKQLELAIEAVFKSWMQPRAVKYRQMENITGLLGTAVNVQSMVFGNMGDDSGTGVAFTRDPATGENKFYGEFLINAQGEDVVAGIRTPLPVDEMPKWNKQVYKELLEIKDTLENHYRDVQDIEFTIEHGTLFMLQTRNGKRTGAAAVKIACDMVKEKLIDEKTAVLRIPGRRPHAAVAAQLQPAGQAAGEEGRPHADDRPARFARRGRRQAGVHRRRSGRPHARRREGAARPQGNEPRRHRRHALGRRHSHQHRRHDEPRGRGRPRLGPLLRRRRRRDHDRRKGHARSKSAARRSPHNDTLSIDGSTGEVMAGTIATQTPKLSGDFATVMSWADKYRTMKIRTNADTPDDAKRAREFGAEGIGLCRTEHMFFEGDRIKDMRAMILANTEKERRAALKDLLPLQRKDFIGIFKAMNGLPVTIRLLDPPLHEFLPHEAKTQAETAKELGITAADVKRARQPAARNEPDARPPRLPPGRHVSRDSGDAGHGDHRSRHRLQGKEDRRPGRDHDPARRHARESCKCSPSRSAQTIADVAEKKKFKGKLDILVGTMIEIPRACLTADEIGAEADFFSFGTNDLTQMTFGFSRDDINTFLPDYLKQEILLARSVPIARYRRRGPARGDGRAARAARPRRTSSAASAASTAAIRIRSSSARRSGWITSRAARSACRSPGWPRPKRRSSKPAPTPAARANKLQR